MDDIKIFRTDDIDLAAFLDASGHAVTVGREANQPLAVFSFKRTTELLTLVEEFVTDAAVVKVRGLLDSRRRLFRSVRSLQGGER